MPAIMPVYAQNTQQIIIENTQPTIGMVVFNSDNFYVQSGSMASKNEVLQINSVGIGTKNNPVANIIIINETQNRTETTPVYIATAKTKKTNHKKVAHKQQPTTQKHTTTVAEIPFGNNPYNNTTTLSGSNKAVVTTTTTISLNKNVGIGTEIKPISKILPKIQNPKTKPSSGFSNLKTAEYSFIHSSRPPPNC